MLRIHCATHRFLFVSLNNIPITDVQKAIVAVDLQEDINLIVCEQEF